jgi:hypothetical protein
MKANWRNGIFYFLVVIMVISSVQDSQAKILYGDRPDEGFPLLQIVKSASSTETHLGNNITVNVNITNWSYEPAFNLTITEPLFSDWAYSSFQGWDEYAYIRVDSNASISYNYTVQIKAEGKYTIGPTEISYLSVNSTEYNSRSQSIPITIFVDSPPISLDEIWRNIFFMSLVLIAVPVGLYSINKYVWRKD